MKRQKPHLGLTWQKRPSPPGAEWSSSSCQEDRQVRGERADDALPPPASAARPRPLQTCHGDAQRSLSLSPPLPGPHCPLCSLSLSHDRAELVAADTVHRGHQPSPAQRLCSSAPPRRLHRPRRAMQPGAHRIAAIDVVFHPGRPRSPATPHRRSSSREPAEHARRPAVSSPLFPPLPRARFRPPAPHRNAPVAPAPAVVVVVVATDHPTARHVHYLKRLVALVP